MVLHIFVLSATEQVSTRQESPSPHSSYVYISRQTTRRNSGYVLFWSCDDASFVSFIFLYSSAMLTSHVAFVRWQVLSPNCTPSLLVFSVEIINLIPFTARQPNNPQQSSTRVSSPASVLPESLVHTPPAFQIPSPLTSTAALSLLRFSDICPQVFRVGFGYALFIVYS